jgi:putative transposase
MWRSQAEGGMPVADVCWRMGVSEASFYVRKKYGQLGLTEIRELRQLRDDNARLKRLAADLTLDKHILWEVIQKTLRSPLSVCAIARSLMAGRDSATNASTSCSAGRVGGEQEAGHSQSPESASVRR